MAIWVNCSKLLKGKALKPLQNNDSTLSSFYTDENVEPTHIRFGFGAITEKEITQSIETLSRVLKD
jgi:GntR family transcriptional regulator/MocR family aminotransferase